MRENWTRQRRTALQR